MAELATIPRRDLLTFFSCSTTQQQGLAITPKPKENPVKSRYLLSGAVVLFSSGLFACGDRTTPEMEPDGGTAAPDDSGNTSAEIASQEITAELMRDYVRELSDDKYEGRGPGSRGDVAARKYLAGLVKACTVLP